MDYKKFDDQTLLRLITKQNEQALSELYDRLVRLVYSIALNALSEHTLAEEVTQDVFFRVWKNATSYDPKHSKVVTWVAGITRNRAIDEFRRLKIRPESKLSSWALEDFDILDESADFETGIELKQEQSRVRKGISQLPPEQQQALSLAYFQGYSHREIAEILDEPLGTIKTRIRLAMRKLRGFLEQEPSIK